jgi:hypothetical protein
MKYKIIQISPPSSDQTVFAAFSETGDRRPKKKSDIFIKPCPSLAMVEEPDGRRMVIGLVVGESQLEDPSAPNFLGYVSSKMEAFNEYWPASKKQD